MKRTKITFLLVMLMSRTCFDAIAHDIAQSYNGKTIYYVWTNNNTELSVSWQGDYYTSVSNEYSGIVYIPESVTYNNQTYSVTSINQNAFNGCTGLTSVSIPNSVKSIGPWAFKGCTSLSTINQGDGVTSIGDEAFRNTGLRSSYGIGGDNLTELGYGVYLDCPNMDGYMVPRNVTRIGGSLVNGSTKLWIDSQNSVYSGDYYCIIEKSNNRLVSACNLSIIPNYVTAIGGHAFYGVDITTFTIPNTISSVDPYAFYNCTTLTSVEIPNSVLSLGNYAFSGCNRLTSVTVKHTTPIAISSNVFSNRANATLYVPFGCVTEYQDANNWKGFKEIVAMDRIDMNNSNISIEPIDAVTYNGSAQTPAVTVMDGTTTLISGTDYTVSYSNNIDAGTATVTITGEGNYTGTKTANFTINAKDASNLTISTISAVTYNGLVQRPFFTVKDGTTPLTALTDFTASYSNNTNAGTATVTITGMGNYTGTKTANFTINKVPLTITAKSYSIQQGDALPTFEAEYSGFVNSETSSVLTTQPTFSCTATSTSSPGTYDIEVDGAFAQNYSMTYVKGILTITLSSVSYTMNSLGIGTYCSEYDLDFTNVSGIAAYIICGFKPSAGNLTTLRVFEVPAETGLYIVGTPGSTYNIPVKSTDFYYTSMMKGVTVDTDISPNEGGYDNYVLASLGNGGVIFRRLTSSTTMYANKAYVQIPSSTAGARAVLGIETEDDSTTGLDGGFTPDTKEAEGDYYNLSGQKVQKPQKGIYIKNGKKIIIH